MSAPPPNKPNLPPEPPTGGQQPAESAAPRGADAPRSAVIPPAFRPVAEPKTESKPSPPPSPNDQAQERDLWWGGFSGRTMFPSFVVCFLLTVGLAMLGWYLFLRWLPHHGDPIRYAVYALAGSVWVFQLVRWGYRVVAMNYRLTTQRLFYSDGFLYPPRNAIELAKLDQIRVEQTWVEKQVGVGRIRIMLVNEKGAPVVLAGVRTPQRIGEVIEKAAKQVRE